MKFFMDTEYKNNLFDKVKRYSFIKYNFAIIEIAYLLILLFLFQGLGLSKTLVEAISKSVKGNYLILPIYILVVYIGYYLLDFPLNLYRSFILEHKFCLSTQKIKDWFKDQIKAAILSYLMGVILLEVFYRILESYPYVWWLIVSIFWIFFTLILAKFIPIVIIPLFFKYGRLSDNALRERIINLASKMKIRILDVFEIDFSKKTLKANAAFLGMGSTKRVILADTLKDKYSYDEIEVILAHEFAHYRLRHLWKLLLVNSIAMVLAFYLIFKTSNYFLILFGLPSLSDIAALPIIIMYLVLLEIIMQPLQNYISRRLEKNADEMAIKITGLKEAFSSMMEKLSSQNLADRNPHPIIKIFFFDHPSIDERINMAKSL